MQSTEPVLDEETYDDTDFYELLLRDLIESNSTADRAPTLSTPSSAHHPLECPPCSPGPSPSARRLHSRDRSRTGRVVYQSCL